jgi:hypothetical protein
VEHVASNALSAKTEIAVGNEEVSSYGWKALAGSVVGFSMDGFDMLILGFMLPAISVDLALTARRRVRWSPGQCSAPFPVGSFSVR